MKPRLTLLLSLLAFVSANAQAPFLQHKRKAFIQTSTIGTAVFDGSDYMSFTSSGPTGLADSKSFTLSVWLNFADAGTFETFFCIRASTIQFSIIVYRNTSGFIKVLAKSPTGATTLDFRGNTAIGSGAGWKHIYICADVTPTARHKIYINSVAESLTVTTVSNDVTDFVGTNMIYEIGRDETAVADLNAAVSNLVFDTTYVDSPASFVSGGHPANIGDGSAIFGHVPVFHLKGNGNAFNVNSGTGPNYTITGSLGTTTPP